MKKMTIFKLSLIACFMIPSWAFVDYITPRQEVIHVTDADVMRKDRDISPSQQSSQIPLTRDVYYIYGDDTSNNISHKYENEDNAWYLKFNSGDVQAQAKSLAQNRGTGLITYYGWRNYIFSWFPNIISLRPVPADTKPSSFWMIFANTVYFLFFGALIGAWELRQYRKRKAASLAATQAVDTPLSGQ
jgi:hypothetical protein